jgi:hypothetical protein
MEQTMTISIFTTLSTLALFISTNGKTNAAYLDPGSGSFILQLLLAALVGGAFIIKTYWKKITGFFRKDSPREKGGDEE